MAPEPHGRARRGARGKTGKVLLTALVGALFLLPALLAGTAPASADVPGHGHGDDHDHGSFAPLVVTSPVNGSTVTGPVTTISGYGGRSENRVSVFVDGRYWCTSAWQHDARWWSCSGRPITAPGKHHVAVFRFGYGDHYAWSVFTIAAPPPTPAAPGILSLDHVSASAESVGASTVEHGLTVSGTAVYDAHYPATVSVSGAGGACTSPVAADGAFSCTLPAPSVGEHSISVTETIAGASDGTSFVLTVFDDSPPPPPTPKTPQVISVTGAKAGIESVTASSVAAGVKVSGTAVYDPNYVATVRVEMTDVGTSCTATVAEDGTFSCVLPPAAVGKHSLEVTETIAGVSDTTTVSFTVVPDPLLRFGSWSLRITNQFGASLSTSTIQPGGTIIVTGTGVLSTATITIELHSTPVVLATLKAAGTGSFTQAAVIPTSTQLGAHTVVVRLSAPGYADDERDFPITVQPAAVAVPRAAQPVPVVAPPAQPKPTPTPQAEIPQKSYPVHNTAKVDPSWTTILSQLSKIGDLKFGPPQLAAAGGMVLGLIFLIALPAVLLEATLRENYPRIFKFAEPVRRLFRPVGARMTANRAGFWAWVSLYTVIVAFILSFADPNVGPNLTSLRLILSLVIAQVVHDLVLVVISRRLAGASLHMPITPVLRPGGIIFVIGGVIVTRSLGLEPGVLFGAWLVLMAIGSTRRHLGELALIRAAVLVGVGLLAWVAYSLLSNTDESFWQLLGTEALSAIMVGALSELVIAMLPLDFLEGHEIWAWSKRAWAITYFVIAALFTIIVLPQPEAWVDLKVPTIVLGIIFGGFGVLCVGVWAAFRFTAPKEVIEEEEEEDVAS